MKAEIVSQLLELNRSFYDVFGDAFAATRRRIQPGVYRVLREWSPAETSADWIDIGCGSGALGQEWAAQGRQGSYSGVDFSLPLLREADKVVSGLNSETSGLKIQYFYGDLMSEEWPAPFSAGDADGVLAFASLHHIPGAAHHRRIFSQVHGLLREGGVFIFSVWQFQHSEKLMKRVQPWSLAGIDPAELEPGDTLLDWRAALPEQTERRGLRYVHLFSEAELRTLAESAGFSVEESFLSDGKEGNQALYMKCRKN